MNMRLTGSVLVLRWSIRRLKWVLRWFSKLLCLISQAYIHVG